MYIFNYDLPLTRRPGLFCVNFFYHKLKSGFSHPMAVGTPRSSSNAALFHKRFAVRVLHACWCTDFPFFYFSFFSLFSFIYAYYATGYCFTHFCKLTNALARTNAHTHTRDVGRLHFLTHSLKLGSNNLHTSKNECSNEGSVTTVAYFARADVNWMCIHPWW